MSERMLQEIQLILTNSIDKTSWRLR